MPAAIENTVVLVREVSISASVGDAKGSNIQRALNKKMLARAESCLDLFAMRAPADPRLAGLKMVLDSKKEKGRDDTPKFLMYMYGGCIRTTRTCHRSYLSFSDSDDGSKPAWQLEQLASQCKRFEKRTGTFDSLDTNKYCPEGDVSCQEIACKQLCAEGGAQYSWACQDGGAKPAK